MAMAGTCALLAVLALVGSSASLASEIHSPVLVGKVVNKCSILSHSTTLCRLSIYHLTGTFGRIRWYASMSPSNVLRRGASAAHQKSNLCSRAGMRH